MGQINMTSRVRTRTHGSVRGRSPRAPPTRPGVKLSPEDTPKNLQSRGNRSGGKNPSQKNRNIATKRNRNSRRYFSLPANFPMPSAILSEIDELARCNGPAPILNGYQYLGFILKNKSADL